MEEKDSEKHLDFIRTHITEDVANQKNEGRVHTRFPLNPMDIFIWGMPRVSV